MSAPMRPCSAVAGAGRRRVSTLHRTALQVVAPKKAKLAEAEAEYAELMVGLNAKKAELQVRTQPLLLLWRRCCSASHQAPCSQAQGGSACAPGMLGRAAVTCQCQQRPS
jgi:hypothetical protein